MQIGQNQRVAIALLTCLVLWCGWQSRLSSQRPENDRAPHDAADGATKKETLSTPTGDRIFGWAAIDVFTGFLFVATVGLEIISAHGIRNQSRETRIIQRAYLAVKPLGVQPMRSDKGKLLGIVGIINAGNLPARNVRSIVTIAPANAGDLKEFPIRDGTMAGSGPAAFGPDQRARTESVRAPYRPPFPIVIIAISTQLHGQL